VNLDDLFLRDSGAGVQIIDILGHEQERWDQDRQSRDRLVRGVRLGRADALAPLAIPLPN